MDVTNTYGLVVGGVLTVLSAAFTFFNRERYKTLVTIYQQGNDELRNQLATAREEITEREKDFAEAEAKYREQSKYVDKLERLNLRLPDYAHIAELISNNHTEVMKGVTDITKMIVGQVHDKRRIRVQSSKSTS